jgi:hypothetical protein
MKPRTRKEKKDYINSHGLGKVVHDMHEKGKKMLKDAMAAKNDGVDNSVWGKYVKPHMDKVGTKRRRRSQ